ncbi:hypothetical protein vseg_009708 [Gypsophila vaccaria]
MPKISSTILHFNGGNFYLLSLSSFRNQFIRRYSCISSINSPDFDVVDDRNTFLKSVRKQCKLGFQNIDIPVNLFTRMISLRPLPSIFDFTAILSGIVKLKHLRPHRTVVSLSRELDLLEEFRPNLHYVCVVANCYCHLGRVDFAFGVFGRSIKLGFATDCVMFNTLINGLIQNDQLRQAVSVLDKVVRLGVRPSVVTHGAMVKGLCRIGDNAGALNLLRKMKSESSICKPNRVIYNTIIDSLCKDRMLTEAKNLFAVMISEGIEPDVFTYNSLIRGMFNLGCQEDATSMLNEMLENDISASAATYNMLVDMHCKDGMVDEAQAIVELMIERGETPSIITYNALLDGYCLCGQMRKAKKLVDLMIKKGCVPDHVTYSTLMSGYIRRRNIDKALEILRMMLQKHITPDVVTFSTLIDGLCKANRVAQARELFERMRGYGIAPNLYTYASLIDGLCKSSQTDEAILLLKEMENRGLPPDIVIYNIVIDHLCEAGQLEEAERIFSILPSKGVVPDSKLYCTLVKGFCKKGLVVEATKLLSKMERNGCPPDSGIYNTLIRAYILGDDLTNAIYYRDIMVNKGFAADVSTVSLFVDLLSRGDKTLLKKFIS